MRRRGRRRRRTPRRASTRSCTPGWRPASSRRTAFVDLDEDDVGGGLRAQPRPRRGGWRAPAPSRCGPARGAWCSSCRPSAWPAPPSSRCSPRSPEGVRVLAKGCGRQWGVDGVTVNTIAAAPHHWLDADTADSLTRAISLSTPAFGDRGRRRRRSRAARRAARRPRRALPHRRHAGRRRRHLDGPVSRPGAARRPDRRRDRRRRRRRAAASRSRARRTARAS